jgi:hypothetical protein
MFSPLNEALALRAKPQIGRLSVEALALGRKVEIIDGSVFPVDLFVQELSNPDHFGFPGLEGHLHFVSDFVLNRGFDSPNACKC